MGRVGVRVSRVGPGLDPGLVARGNPSVSLRVGGAFGALGQMGGWAAVRSGGLAF